MGVRKDRVILTAAEKAAFVAAVRRPKADGSYDHHVPEHRTAMLSVSPAPAVLRVGRGRHVNTRARG